MMSLEKYLALLSNAGRFLDTDDATANQHCRMFHRAV
jgi:hypothetical protein